MTRRLVIGSRASRLALIQTESVVARLKSLSPDIETGIRKVTTSGDRDRHARLDRLEGVGVFVKELEEVLLDGRIDVAVHSLKDMPTDIPSGLRLIAVTERAAPGDVLVASARLDQLAPGSRIGTGSLRRSVQLKQLRPDIEVRSIRGNVDTRLRKVTEGEVDGVILAAAALLRLGCEDRITEYLPVEHFLPSPGQGALAIEARADDAETAEVVDPLNDSATWQCVTAERTFLRELGGGCRAPIAALGTVEGSRLRLQGMVADAAGSRMLRDEIEGDARQPEEVGRKLSQRMLARGAGQLVSEAVKR